VGFLRGEVSDRFSIP